MKSLYDYDVLVYDVFHRCFHILEYMEKHPNMDELEREVISNTIMDALVYNKLVDKDEETLDLDNLCIRKSKFYFKYQEKPNVTGIPLWMKEKLRTKKIKITSGMPASMFLAKPPGFAHYCLYDPCDAVSTIFDDFTLIDAIYDSPTRKGVRLTESRPFLEVNLEGEPYLIDVLLKRMYRKEYFQERFNMEVINSKSKKKFNAMDKYYYQKEIAQESNNFATSLFCFKDVIDFICDTGDYAEMYYELELSKKNEPEAWQKYYFEVENFNNWKKSLKD